VTHDFYTQEPEAQVAALAELARTALPAFGIDPAATLETVTERENAVFRATGAGQTGPGTYAVRVHRAGYHADAELRSHAAWARALTADGIVATAPVIETVEGDVVARARHPSVPEERQVTVLGWVEGTIFSEAATDGSDDGVDDETTYHRVGQLMARLHAHAERWAPPPDFEVLSWDGDGLLGEDATWGRFWDASLLDDDGRALMTRFRDRTRAVLDELGTGPDHFGLVHGDFLPENLLLAPDGTITLLDFDDCGRGWFLFDIATALFMPSIDETYPAVRDAFVSGYREVRSLPDADVALLPWFLALRAATYVGWMETRSHTRFAQDMGPLVAAGAVDLIGTLLDGDP